MGFANAKQQKQNTVGSDPRGWLLGSNPPLLQRLTDLKFNAVYVLVKEEILQS